MNMGGMNFLSAPQLRKESHKLITTTLLWIYVRLKKLMSYYGNSIMLMSGRSLYLLNNVYLGKRKNMNLTCAKNRMSWRVNQLHEA